MKLAEPYDMTPVSSLSRYCFFSDNHKIALLTMLKVIEDIQRRLKQEKDDLESLALKIADTCSVMEM